MLVFFLMCCIILLILFTCTIKIKIENFELDTMKTKKNSIYFQIYIIGRLKICEVNLSRLRWKKVDFTKMKEKIKWKKVKLHFPSKKERDKIISKIHLETIQLYISIGTENAMLTSFGVAILASGIGIILSKLVNSKNQEKCFYKVEPSYEGNNQCKLKLDSIISIKIVHIIYILYIVLKKRRVDKYGRASNRRSYDYSYE